MDEEPLIYPIIRDKNALLEEIEDDTTAVREKKGLIIKHEELEEADSDLRLTDYKTNKPELEVLAKKLIEIRKKIREKAQEHEESLREPAKDDAESMALPQVRLNRKFQNKKRRTMKVKQPVVPELT